MIPLVQGPISGAACPELAIAVIRAGAIGGLALSWKTPGEADEAIAEILGAVDGPLYVNFALRFDPVCLPVALSRKVSAVTFSWGWPGELARQCHDSGVLVGIQVTDRESSLRAQEEGADFLVAQGVEAGGRVQSSRTTFAVLADALETGLPVWIGGGISDGRMMAKALDAGATAVVMGTRFVATRESRSHAIYKDALVKARDGDSVLTHCFDDGWEGAQHRVLKNSTFSIWEAAGRPASPRRPGEGDVIAHTPSGEEILRYEFAKPMDGYVGNVEAMAMYSGTGLDSIQDVPSAGELVHRIWAECQFYRSRSS